MKKATVSLPSPLGPLCSWSCGGPLNVSEVFPCVTINRIPGKSSLRVAFRTPSVLYTVEGCCPDEGMRWRWFPPQYISEELNLRRSSCPDDGWDIWRRERRTRRERGNTLICILDPLAGSQEETSPSEVGRDLWTRRR